MSSVAQLAAVKAMDGLYLRSAAIAENVANANSVSYRPKSVDFEGELRQALLRGTSALEAYTPRIETAPVAIAGDDIRIDLELANSSATALRYAALTDILNRQMQLAHLAVQGGQ